MANPKPPIVLATTSPFRKVSLERLGIGFSMIDPAVDETARPGEGAKDLAIRLACEKALSGVAKSPGAIVIAGDQVLEANNRIYGKPGGRESALRHLTELSGKSGVFHSAMCVMHETKMREVCMPTKVRWRRLSEAQIHSYVEREPSYGSAGAAQLEKLGISLVEELASEDPSSILGLPLISLATFLEEIGAPVL